LIHGFLVRLVLKTGGSAAASRTPSTAIDGGMTARRLFPADTKYEGPADDATFH